MLDLNNYSFPWQALFMWGGGSLQIRVVLHSGKYSIS
jgi:hypothetical protein